MFYVSLTEVNSLNFEIEKYKQESDYVIFPYSLTKILGE